MGWEESFVFFFSSPPPPPPPPPSSFFLFAKKVKGQDPLKVQAGTIINTRKDTIPKGELAETSVCHSVIPRVDWTDLAG